MSAQNLESKYEAESSCELIKQIKNDGVIFELYKSDGKDVLFRIEARDETSKWILDLTADHLVGQSCRSVICQFPELFVKLFAATNLCQGPSEENDDGSLECEFVGDVMSVELTLKKVAESESELMKKTIRKQSAMIDLLQKQIKDHHRRLEIFEEYVARRKK